jgi:hypothetical protein
MRPIFRFANRTRKLDAMRAFKQRHCGCCVLLYALYASRDVRHVIDLWGDFDAGRNKKCKCINRYKAIQAKLFHRINFETFITPFKLKQLNSAICLSKLSKTLETQSSMGTQFQERQPAADEDYYLVYVCEMLRVSRLPIKLHVDVCVNL